MRARRDGRVLTRRFAGTIAAAAVLAVAAILTQTASLAVVGAFLALAAAFGASAPRHLRLDSAVRLGRAEPAEDETIPVRLEIAAGRRRTRLAEWKLRLPTIARSSRGPTAGLATLGPGRVTARLDVEIPLFGLHRVGPLHVQVGDPFGFATHQGRVGQAQEVRVYPRRGEDEGSILKSKQQRTLLGLYEVAQPGDGFEFFALRDYHHGDRPRDVNWKASGRYGRLIVNQHQKENNAEIILLVDVRALTGVGPVTFSPFALGCRAALTVAEGHLRARDTVRLVAYGDRVHEDRHTGPHRQLQGILDLVVGLEPAGDMPLGQVVDDIMPSLRPRTPVMIFSPLVGDPTVEDAVTRLMSRDMPVVVFVAEPPLRPEDRPADARWLVAQMVAVRRVRNLGVEIVESRDHPEYEPVEIPDDAELEDVIA